MGPYCFMWLRMFGMALPACYLPVWAGKAVWPRAGSVPASGAALPGPGMPPGVAGPGGVLTGTAGWGQYGVPGPFGAGPQPVAGLGRWFPEPEPGAMLAPIIGPGGPLTTVRAEQAGPGVPDPWLQTIGPPGTPITPGSAGAAGDPIGGE